MTEPSSQSIATDLQNLNWAAATAPTATNENESDVSQRIPSSRAEFSAASSVASTSSSVATPVRSNPQQPQHHPSNHPARGGGRGGGGRSAVGGRGLVSTTHNNHNQGPPPPASTAPRPFPMTVHSSSGVPFGHVPAYLPGSASLVEELDRRVLLVLRDGKHIVGTLASFDQFSNMVLLDAMERRILCLSSSSSPSDSSAAAAPKSYTSCRYYYTDIPLGIYIVRGDSLVLAGEVYPDEDFIYSQQSSAMGHNNHGPMQRVSLSEWNDLSKQHSQQQPQSTSASTTVVPPLNWDFDGDLIA